MYIYMCVYIYLPKQGAATLDPISSLHSSRSGALADLGLSFLGSGGGSGGSGSGASTEVFGILLKGMTGFLQRGLAVGVI